VTYCDHITDEEILWRADTKRIPDIVVENTNQGWQDISYAYPKTDQLKLLYCGYQQKKENGQRNMENIPGRIWRE